MESMERMERRRVLAGLAAAPALLTLHATSTSALASAVGLGASPAGDGPRHFPWPLIQPGSRITWPAGAVALVADGKTRRRPRRPDPRFRPAGRPGPARVPDRLP